MIQSALKTSVATVLLAGGAFAHSGPVTVEGVVSSNNFTFQPAFWPNPTVALLDATHIVSGNFNRFVAAENQVLGRFTDPLFTGEGRYRIDLPIAPPGERLDLDGDGVAGLGVFAVLAAPNLSSDSYLEQIEQDGGLASILRDPRTGGLDRGTVLLFSEDGSERFPSAPGDDGLWFTADDPLTTPPRGWSAAPFGGDGSVVFDTREQLEIDTIEAAEAASPDFSALGYVEAFDALLDHLRGRYAYTEFRGIDWDLVASTYRPRIVQAEKDDSPGDWYLALRDMALAFEDTHTVATVGYLNEAINSARNEAEDAAFGAGIGAEGLVVSDPDAGIAPGDRIVVARVADGSPAAAAGWTEGTEILEVNGVPVRDQLAALPLIQATGVEELQPYLRAPRLLRFPAGETVTFTFRNPGQTEAQTASMTAGDHLLEFEAHGVMPSNMPIDLSRVGGVAIVSWRNFSDHMLSKVAVLEEALEIEAQAGSVGMILDLRGNGGGLVELYEIMASYFFDENDPMPEQLFDTWEYDADTGGFVKSFVAGRTLHSPRPDIAFTGPLVILIDQGCASACEYFTQHLQLLERAVVVGQHASLGAGGFVDRITLPEEVTFQYTAGRTTFRDSDVPNLEATGVVPDIRIPVTLETLAAFRNDEDPVMDAAFDVIAELSDPKRKLTANSWTWTRAATVDLEEIMISDGRDYNVTFSEDGTYTLVADCNRITGAWTLEDSQLTLSAGPATLAFCPEPSLGEAFSRLLVATNSLQFDGDNLVLVVQDDSYRVLQLEATE